MLRQFVTKVFVSVISVLRMVVMMNNYVIPLPGFDSDIAFLASQYETGRIKKSFSKRAVG